MGEVYLIFKKDDVNKPIQEYDRFGNCSNIELPEKDAIEYVNKKNTECGEPRYHYEKLSAWLQRMSSPRMIEKAQQNEEHRKEIFNELMESTRIREIIDKDLIARDKNINGFQIPFDAENNEDYEEKLKEILSAYKTEINRPAFEKEENLIADVCDICDKVLNAFDAAKEGKYEEAEKLVSEILKDYKQYPFAVSELDKSYAFRGLAPYEDLRPSWGDKKNYENMLNGDLSFFRARVVGAEEKIDEMEEINYLPYSKRSLSKDMRFSSKGKVCLYLGTTSYVCSEECRWNKKDNLYLSSYKFNEKGKRLNILNLVVLQALMNGMIPREKDDILQKDLHNAMIRVFPFVIATMFTIKTSDKVREEKYHETIKYEYLLSQILMNVLQKEGIDGVAYLSRQGKDDFQYPQMVCLAIPVTDTNQETEYGDLINCYEMTRPVLANDKLANSKLANDKVDFEKKSYINEKWPMQVKKEWGERENTNAKVCYEEQDIFYQETPFSRIDDYMVNQKYKKFDRMNTLKGIGKKISKLWQSKDENFKNMYMGTGIFFVISCLCALYFLGVRNERDLLSVIVKYVFAYFASFTLSTSVAMLIWGFYVNNSCKILKYVKWLFVFLFVIISLWEILIGIPALCFILAVEKIIDRRAKTFEIFFKCVLAQIFIAFALASLLSPNLLFSIWIINKVSILLTDINVSRCIWFMVITLCVVESFLICSILLLVMMLRQNRRKKPQSENCNDLLEGDIEYQENELVKFIEEKIDSKENNLDITNKRLIEYVWNSIKRRWLLILVGVFAGITFNFLKFDAIENQGEDINAVLTIYTLILLYLDKRKQWK